MNREPSTTIPTAGGLPLPKGGKPALYKGIFKAAREAFPRKKITGLVALKDSRAFFQAVGDSTPYSILLTKAEKDYFL